MLATLLDVVRQIDPHPVVSFCIQVVLAWILVDIVLSLLRVRL